MSVFSHPQLSTKILCGTNSASDPKIYVCLLRLVKIPLCFLLKFLASCLAEAQHLAKVLRGKRALCLRHPKYLPKALILSPSCPQLLSTRFELYPQLTEFPGQKATQKPTAFYRVSLSRVMKPQITKKACKYTVISFLQK